MTANPGPWESYLPNPDDPWDLGKVAHLHRRAGFGATRGELHRDLRDGPEKSIERLLHPPAETAERRQVIDGLRRGVLDSGDPGRLRAWWLYRMLDGPAPLVERMTLFWHGHFATSLVKVEGVAPMLAQNETLREHALGDFAALLRAVAADPAMLVWLDGGSSREERPNENFAREFLELFTLGPGHYTEADVKEAARAFTGWERIPDESRSNPPRFRYVPERHDDGEKTFLGREGRWGPDDVVRIVLEPPAAGEFLASKLYRALVSERGEPAPGLIAPLADEFRRGGGSIGHVVGVILRSRHFFAAENRRQRIKGPVEFCLGMARATELPRAGLSLLALAAAGGRMGQELFAPPNVKGWDGGASWLNTSTVIERGNWAGACVWGDPDFGLAPFDPIAWGRRHGLGPADVPDALAGLLLGDELDPEDRCTFLRATRGGGPDDLRRGLQILLNCPEYQLA